MKKWYVVHVKSNEEMKAKKLVEKEIEDIKVIVPQRIIPEKRQGETRHVKKILFTGYLFLNVELDVDTYYKLKRIPSIHRFLGLEKPEAIPLEEMQRVLRLCNQGELIGLSKVIVKEGNKVQVVSGPLLGMEGHIIKVDKRKGRAKVCLSVLGDAKTVDLGIEIIKVSE
ncbi:antiterminator LoaP [Alkaliphilus metalliredigens]|uniref:antiterminator LoaP n=1 Tax=Alkaliphilus metalliredigens TaxID=208226 RepID=UPI00059F029C|nr:antiterminator LoaP [Alkaliphilus metalliredigens]